MLPQKGIYYEIYSDKLCRNKRLDKFSPYFKDFDITNLQEIFELWSSRKERLTG